MYNNATTTFPYEYIRTFSTSRKICERTVKHLAAKFFIISVSDKSYVVTC